MGRQNAIVIAYHLIWVAYGWWLPNDPRGSTSKMIRNDVIGELGALYQGRKRVQPSGGELRTFYREAGERLEHELLKFDAHQHKVIAEAFEETIKEETYTCWACAVMPDHVHLVIRKHRHKAEEMMRNLQARSRERMKREAHRSPSHPTWGGPGWKIFLDHPDDVWRTIRYVEDNPKKMGMPDQKWSFVRAYDNWPLHEGHSADSPYANAYRAQGR